MAFQECIPLDYSVLYSALDNLIWTSPGCCRADSARAKPTFHFLFKPAILHAVSSGSFTAEAWNALQLAPDSEMVTMLEEVVMKFDSIDDIDLVVPFQTGIPAGKDLA